MPATSIPHRRVETWHESHVCPYCGRSIDGYLPYHLLEDEDGGDIFCCDECFDSWYGVCCECGEVFDLADGEYDDTKFVCSDCFESERYERCEGCEQLLRKRDMTQTEDSDNWFCRRCLHENCWRCNDCGRWFEYNDDYHNDGNTIVCESCYRDNWYTCEDCGCLVHCEDAYIRYDTAYCGDCDPGESDEDDEPDDDRVHEYSYKPDGVFHKTRQDPPRKLFEGVELEFSHECWDDWRSNLSVFENFFGDEQDFYLKSDASLERGFEMVSHPRTLASWHELRPRLESFFAAVCECCIEGRDGLHVHLSRKGMTPSHMTRFGVFIAAEQEHVEVIARRNSEQWARYPQKPKTGADCAMCGHNVTRYAAVNWQNGATVELRVFRSTTDITEFYAAIEFSHAAYQFTKNVITLQQLLKGVAWPMFMDFVHGYPDKYPALIEFLAVHATYNEEVA